MKKERREWPGPEAVLEHFFKNRRRGAGKVFGFTFLLGVCLYLRMITQWLANPDGVWQGLVWKQDYGWENSLGRIGLEKAAALRGYYVFPSAQTLLNLLLTAVLAVLLYELFEMESCLAGCLSGALLVCSPSLCSTLTYYYTADAYQAAFLCAVLAVCLMAGKRGILSLGAAALCLTVSLTLYQAYLGTAVALCLLYLLYLLLARGKEAGELFRQGGRFLAGGAAGTLAYFAVYKLYCGVAGVLPESSRGFDRMGLLPWGKLPSLLAEAYRVFVDYFFTDRLYNNSWRHRGTANVLAAVLLLFAVVLMFRLNGLHRDWKKVALAAVGLALLPLAFCSVVVMAPAVSVREITGILMLPHMNFLYIFLIALLFRRLPGRFAVGARWASLAVCGWLAVTLGLYTQVFQNSMEADLRVSYTLACRMAERVEALPDYSAGMKLVVGGRADRGNYPRLYPQMAGVGSGTALEYGYFWDSPSGRQACWNQFFRQYLGIGFGLCDGEQTRRILTSPEYGAMPLFPADGSVRVMEGCAVVKLSGE